MTTATWGFLFFAVYLVGTAFLSWRGARKTASFASYAAGSSDLGVLPTALVAAACLTSTATFAINPGFVYRDGLAALIGFSVPVALGVALSFAILGRKVRETSMGPDGTIKVLTLPQWIGTRFESPRLRSLYAVLLLGLFGYAIMVLVGASYVAQSTLGIDASWAAVLLMAIVVPYTMFGGTHAHASTNVAKALLLLGAAALLGVQAARHLSGGKLEALRTVDANLLAVVKPGSPLFGDAFSVFVAPLVIGFALACQPHVIVKALYVKDAAKISRAGWTTAGLFLLLGGPALLVGLAARAELGEGLLPNKVAAAWTAGAFPAPLAALIGVVLIAAAIGTLNALLLSLGTTIAHDVMGRFLGGEKSLTHVRIATCLVGGASAAVAWKPPAEVWTVGSMGVYGLVAAACPAVCAGILTVRPSATWIAVASIVAPLVHGVLYGAGFSANPNLTGTAGIACGFAIVTLGRALARAPRSVHREALATGARVERDVLVAS